SRPPRVETPPILPFRLLAHAGHQSTIVASLAPHRRINADRLAHLKRLGNPPIAPSIQIRRKTLRHFFRHSPRESQIYAGYSRYRLPNLSLSGHDPQQTGSEHCAFADKICTFCVSRAAGGDLVRISKTAVFRLSPRL